MNAGSSAPRVKTEATAMRKGLKTHYVVAGTVALLTFLIFLPALRNGFVNWDDNLYVYDNVFIRTINTDFFIWAFSDLRIASNWHPLTWISHGVDYAVWGLDPLGHHLSNNLLHAVNAFLVVLLVVRLLASRQTAEPARWQAGQPAGPHNSRFALIAAGTTGLLFGIHPLHVESVAWVSERKDLLCGLFFLLSIMMYVKYAANASQRAKGTGQKDAMQGAEGREQRAKDKGTKKENSLRYALCALCDRSMRYALCFFVLALLSKPMAVTLPAVLLILDWYPLGRIRSWGEIRGAIVEKVPFIAFSLASSVMTVLAQAAEAQPLETFPLFTRLIVGASAFVSYLWKMVLPLNLNPFYSYPQDVTLASLKYLVPVLLVAGMTAVAGAVAGRRRIWLAVWGYYVATLLPVIGIIQVGNQAMADRYTYLPSLGPFLIAGVAFAWLYEKATKMSQWRIAVSLVSAGAVGVFVSISYLTIAQIGVWKDEFTLWDHVIEQEPGKTFFAYNNRGIAYSNRGNFDKAVEDYNTAIAMKPDYFRVYNNRGVAFSRTGLYEKAIEDFSRAIGLSPNFDDAYSNRGIAYEKTGQFEKAMEDFQRAIVLNPLSEKAFINRGVTYQKVGMLDQAIKDFDAAIHINPDSFTAYNNRGICFHKKGLLDRAIEDYTRAIALNPHFKEAYYNRALSYYRMGFPDRALQDMHMSGAR